MKHSLYTGGLDLEIIELVKQTFTNSEGANEGNLIGALIQRFFKTTPKNDLRVFISLDKNQLVACVFFSRLTFDESTINTWLLSPAAVSTDLHGKGIGKDLINYAHEYLKKEGVQQVVTYGDIKFYSKVGYRPISEKEIPSPLKLTYPEGWIAQALDGSILTSITGKSFCVEALNSPELW